MARESEAGRVTVMFAKIVKKDAKSGEYELEIMGGKRFVLDAKAVEKIEKHVDPITGIAVAKVTLESDADITMVTKVRDLTQNATVPFVFGGGGMPQLPGLTPLLDGPIPVGPGDPWEGRQPPVVPYPVWRFPGEMGAGTTCMYNSHTYCASLVGRVHDDFGGGDMSTDD